MIRKLNRIFQNFMRKKRLAIGKFIWDRKERNIQIKKENIIENNNINSILFLRYDGKIGDMVINTLMFKNIKKEYPNVKIGVVTRKGTAKLLENNPHVDKIYLYSKERKIANKISKEIAEEHYDLLIDFSEVLRVYQMKFINKCKAKINMGFCKRDWKLFDISYEAPKQDYHITELYKKVLEILGVTKIDLTYDLYFSEEEKNEVEEKIEKYKNMEKYILNPFAASKHREINKENIKKIIECILKKENRVVFIIAEKNKEELVNEIIKDYSEDVVFLGLSGIMETAYLIKISDFIISPDTSIVHIAACFKKRMIAIYRLDGTLDNNINMKLWGPNCEKAYQIYSVDRDVKKGEEPSINKFSLEEIDRIINF